MNAYLIETVLALFWTGFVGLNLWLWRANESENMSDVLNGVGETEGEKSCNIQSAR